MPAMVTASSVECDRKMSNLDAPRRPASACNAVFAAEAVSALFGYERWKA